LAVIAAAYAMTFASGPKPAAAADAVPGGNGGSVTLGKNWGAYESFGGVSFRWVANDAQIEVHGNGLVRVALSCEGGPSLGTTAFPLRVLDASGRQVDHADCAGASRMVEFILPVRGQAQYVLHVDGGGRPVAGERRILNFRVFSLDGGGTASGAGSDIVSSKNGVRLGSGWYPVERFAGQTFRWVQGSDAQFYVSADRDMDSRLRVLVQPGPSVGASSVSVDVRDGSGPLLTTASARGLQALNFPVHLHAGENAFALHLGPSRNVAVPHDRRLLNLRAFSIAALR
jgi:hypothetical protein